MRGFEESSKAGGHGQGASTGEPALGDILRGERASLGRSLLDVQRDLRIRAGYIAGIEDCDAAVFPDPSFVAGYVRSYARYLKLDPEDVHVRFCAESGFPGAADPAKTAAAGPGGGFRPGLVLAERPRLGLSAVPSAAIGSLVLLVAMIGGLGYGGWSVLQNIQRVQFAPVDEIPVAFAEAPTLPAPEAASAEPVVPTFAQPVAATALSELYRQQELEVPILVPRDGPIAAIDPDKIGVLARARPETAIVASLATTEGGLPLAGEDAGRAALAGDGAAQDGVPLVAAGPPRLSVVAERPAWIRVYLASGTVIFERILESGEVYEPPQDLEEPLIWAGNSGSVYVRLDDRLHGPIGRGTRAARDIVLEPAAIAERFGVVDEVPAAISEAIGNLAVSENVLIQ
ncbi:helix-turn-helix domain-containing protein [soil metagenome]